MTTPRRAAPERPAYTLTRIPRNRQPVLDRLISARRRFQVHALLEVDVTEAKARIVDSDHRISWTGFVIATIGRAVALHPEVNARKAGNRILVFDRVDIGATVERQWQGHAMLDVATIRDADRRSGTEISELLHEAKVGRARPVSPSGWMAGLSKLPGPLRRTAFRVAATTPRAACRLGPAVGVTSIGMYSSGWGWAVPLAPLTLIATVGEVMDRPVVYEGRVVARPLLPITLSFDHAVIDGAPAARFTAAFRSLAETAVALDDPRRTAVQPLGHS